MPAKTLWTCIKEALSNTSVRGLSRIVKSQNWPCGILWAFMVSGLIVMALINAHGVLHDYFNYPTVTVQDEFVFYQDMDETREFFKKQFPTVTVCNTRPFGSNASSRYAFLTYDEYLKEVEKKVENVTNIDLTDLMSPYGYFSYLGIQGSLDMGHEFEDFVVSCEVLVTLYGMNQSCDEIILKPKPLAHPFYFKCYLIEVNTTKLQDHSLPLGITLTLYTGSIEDGLPNPRAKGYWEKQLDAGVQLAIETPGKYPKLDSEASHLAPGQHHRINVGLSYHHHLPDPYTLKGCSTNPFWELDSSMLKIQTPSENDTHLWDLTGNKVGYSQIAQIMAKAQAVIWQTCSCMDPTIPVIENRTAIQTFTFCGNIRVRPVELVAERMECMKRVKKQAVLEAAKHSKLECTEEMISCDNSAYEWPRPLEQLNFYRNFIKNQSFEHHFHKYTEIEKLIERGHTKEAIEELKSTNLISQNFMKVTVVNKGLVVPRSIERTKYDTMTFLSALGGALNLWAGITVVCLLEMLELAKNLIVYFYYKIRGVEILDD